MNPISEFLFLIKGCYDLLHRMKLLCKDRIAHHRIAKFCYIQTIFFQITAIFPSFRLFGFSLGLASSHFYCSKGKTRKEKQQGSVLGIYSLSVHARVRHGRAGYNSFAIYLSLCLCWEMNYWFLSNIYWFFIEMQFTCHKKMFDVSSPDWYRLVAFFFLILFFIMWLMLT